MTIAGTAYTQRGIGGNDLFIKFPSSSGNPMWATQLSSLSGTEINDFKVHSTTGDIYAAGEAQGDVQLGTGGTSVTATLLDTDQSGIYIKLTAAGVPVFVKTISAVEPPDINILNLDSIVLDEATNSAWCTGYYSPGVVTFAGKPLNVYNPNDATVIVARYGLDGTEIEATNYYSDGPVSGASAYVLTSCSWAGVCATIRWHL